MHIKQSIIFTKMNVFNKMFDIFVLGSINCNCKLYYNLQLKFNLIT